VRGLSELLVRGIRTAARKKIGRPPRVPIATAVVLLAARAVRTLFPKIRSLHLVGSRLRRKAARDLDFVAVVDRQEDLPGRNITTRAGEISINLFFALPDEAESTILEFGLGLDVIRWKKAAIMRGFRLNRFGLWKGSKRVSTRMAEIAGILGMPLKPFLVATLENPL